MPHHLVDLYRSANCYISLHRSEGFGRTLVEALQNNLSLVTTNHSGPADFLNDDNACLVSWQSRKLLPGEYPHSQGSVWAEPNVTEATERLNQLYAQRHTKPSDAGLKTGQAFQTEILAKRYQPIIQSYLL